MKRLLMICALMILAACNRVETGKPLFGPADAVGAPLLRDGVWLFENKAAFDTQGQLEEPEDCVPDRQRPPSQWSSCAKWFVVEGNQVREPGNDGQGRFRWDRRLFLLVGGEPPILQTLEVDDAGEATYHYFSLTPVATGADGKVTAFQLWIVQCGPPPAQGNGEATRYLTWTLSPGLTGQGDNCTTNSKDAIRSAGLASRSWQTAGQLVWVTGAYR